MTRRLTEAAKGLAALAALALVVCGPPVALVHFVGWPLPKRIPALDEITTAVRSGIDDMVLVKALAVLAWLSWSQLALAALVEVTGALRNRPPRAAPVIPLARMTMARLVAASALLFVGFHPPRAQLVPLATLAAVVAPPRNAPMAAQEVAPDLPPPAPAVAVKAEDAGGALETYVVRGGDSWWGIAQAHLDDGRRWKEVRSANVGRAMPDGSVIADSTEIIRKGWQILLPRPAGTTSTGHPTASAATATEVIVQPGDSLWTIAESQLRAQDASVSKQALDRYWRQLIEANRDRLADPADPNRIYKGQRIVLPSVAVNGVAPTPSPQPAEASVPEPAVPAVPDDRPSPRLTRTTSPTSRVTSAAEPRRQRRSAESPRSAARGERKRVTPTAAKSPTHQPAPRSNGTGVPELGMLGAASTLLAVGIAAALRRGQHRRRLQLPANTQPPLPPEELDELRAELCVHADLDSATRLERALLEIAEALAARQSEARPRLVQVRGRRIEVLLSSLAPQPPPGWRAEASGAAWVLEANPGEHPDNPACPTPLLVSIGAPEANTELYLDLEAEGVVALTGEPEEVAGAARSWILELATSPLAGGVSVAVLGADLAPDPATSERLRVLSSWEEIADDSLAWVEQSYALIGANRWPTPVAGRARSSRADDLAPLVVFLADPPGDDRFEELCAAIADRQVTVTLVVVGAVVEGATRVEVSGGELRIPSLGLNCQAQATTAEVVSQVAELLDDATRLPAQLALIPPPGPPAAPPPAASTETVEGAYRDPPFDILVRFLGDIAVLGANRELTPKQMAVFAYIALNAPVASDRVEDALWVGATVSRRKRLANTISECRAALGTAHLPVATDGRYRVGPGVLTDLELFDRRVAYAAQQSKTDSVDTLRGALELVEGPVFTYRNADRSSYVWVSVHNWISTWELKVADTAEDLAQRYLDLDDAAGAIWAARRGLRASEIHSRLTKLLIQAYLLKGDVKAADQVFAAHQTALHELDLDEIDSELVDLYHDLRQPRGAAAS